VEVEQDPVSGAVKVRKREKDELEEEMEEVKRKRLAKKGIVRRSQEEKRQLRRLREKKRKNKGKKITVENGEEEEKEFEGKVDPTFGDVVHAPPALPRLASAEARRPGAKSGLILAKKLDGKPSLARQAALESERQRVIEAYREIKRKKMQS